MAAPFAERCCCTADDITFLDEELDMEFEPSSRFATSAGTVQNVEIDDR